MTTLAQQLGHVLLAMGLGAVIGLDRELEDKPAGLRTHMLVAGAATTFVHLGYVAAREFNAQLANGATRADPILIIEAVVTGVSFLGAGTILRQRSEAHVEGLTTAASILLTAAVGVAVALGQIVFAIGVTLIVLLTLRGLGTVANDLAPPTEEAKDTATRDENVGC